MAKMLRRMLAMLLAVILVVGQIPVVASANDATEPSGTEAPTETAPSMEDLQDTYMETPGETQGQQNVNGYEVDTDIDKGPIETDPATGGSSQTITEQGSVPAETQAPAPAETEAPTPTEAQAPTPTEAPSTPTEAQVPAPTDAYYFEESTTTITPNVTEPPAETEAPSEPSPTEAPSEPSPTEAPAEAPTEAPTEPTLGTLIEEVANGAASSATTATTPSETSETAPTPTENIPTDPNDLFSENLDDYTKVEDPTNPSTESEAPTTVAQSSSGPVDSGWYYMSGDEKVFLTEQSVTRPKSKTLSNDELALPHPVKEWVAVLNENGEPVLDENGEPVYTVIYEKGSMEATVPQVEVKTENPNDDSYTEVVPEGMITDDNYEPGANYPDEKLQTSTKFDIHIDNGKKPPFFGSDIDIIFPASDGNNYIFSFDSSSAGGNGKAWQGDGKQFPGLGLVKGEPDSYVMVTVVDGDVRYLAKLVAFNKGTSKGNGTEDYVFDSWETITYEKKETVPLHDEIEITDYTQVLDPKYSNTDEYKIEEIRDAEGKLLGWKAIPLKSTETKNVEITNEEKVDTSTIYTAQQVKDPQKDGLETLFTDEDGNLKDGVTETHVNNTTKTYTYINENGETYVKTVTMEPIKKVSGMDANGNPIYEVTEDGQFVYEKNEDGTQKTQESVTYTKTTVEFKDATLLNSVSAENITEADEAAFKAVNDGDYSEVTGDRVPQPVDQAKIEALKAMAGTTVDGDQIQTVTAGTEAKDENGRYYQDVTITGIDAEGKTFTETRRVYGDLKTTTTYYEYDATTKTVYTYQREAHETVETTIFIETTKTTTETSSATGSVTVDYAKEVEYFELDQPTAEELKNGQNDELKFEYDGTMYWVEDLNTEESNEVNASDIKAAGITVNNMVTTNTYNTDITLTLKNGVGDSMIAVVVDDEGNELGRYRLSDKKVNGLVTLADGLTGTQQVTAEDEKYVLDGLTLTNGVRFTISLTTDDLSTGSYTLSSGNVDNVAAVVGADLAFDMSFTGKAPKMNKRVELEVTTATAEYALLKTETSEEEKTNMQIERVTTVYSDTSSDVIKIEGVLYTHEEVETESLTTWNRLARKFLPNPDNRSGGPTDPTPTTTGATDPSGSETTGATTAPTTPTTAPTTPTTAPTTPTTAPTTPTTAPTTPTTAPTEPDPTTAPTLPPVVPGETTAPTEAPVVPPVVPPVTPDPDPTPDPTPDPDPTPAPAPAPAPAPEPAPEPDVPAPAALYDDGPGLPEFTVIDETPVPMAVEPAIKVKPQKTEDGLTTIEDEMVPLADAPETGDPTLIFGAMGLVSMAGYSLLGKKKKEEEEA